MKRSFERLSLRPKLVCVMVATTVAALLLPSGAMLVHELIQARDVAVTRLSSKAQLLASSSAAPLAFADEKAAAEVLAGLAAVPDVVQATLFDKTATPLAEYTTASAPMNRLVLPPGGGGEIRFENNFLVIFQPVHLRGDFVGTVALMSDLRGQRNRMNVGIAIIAGSLLAALAVSVLLSSRLQRLISSPVIALADVARNVRLQKDYSLRVQTNRQDEIGRLMVDFNEMLAEIERRDSQLRVSEERFRQLAESVREVFWMSDVEKTAILYVSPAYEEVWGRPAESVYASAGDWLEAIHPDDRCRIQLAAAAKQRTGEYDEEYRIVRPDGTIRWIHDRAFPIRDKDGQVYRLAGIAEDITVRKQLEKQLLEISDREQSRFGQDLHDGLCQHLVRIGFASNVLCEELNQQHHPQAERAKKIAGLTDEAITQARRLARGLYPVKLETEGLHSALEELAASVRANDQIDVEVQWTGSHEIAVADHPVSVHLYRIAQEAVANAVKHARPNRIAIALNDIGNHQLKLSVQDDGSGISGKRCNGMGLHIMKYRARMINAVLDVYSPTGGGTVVSCTFNHPTGAISFPSTTSKT